MTTQQQRELGRKIYNEALYDRRGFRPDQMGIEDEDTWDEIYEAIGQAAQAQQMNSEADDALAADYGKCLSMLGCDLDAGEDIPLCLSDMLDELLNPRKPAQSRFRRGIPG